MKKNPPVSKAAQKPRISVVIPAYNEANYITETIQSLKKQDFAGKYEIIVVDNNCTDDTAEIARALGAKVVSEPHPGVCWARQRGTERAHGDIIVSTDADTSFSPDWLTNIDTAFTSDPTVVAVAGPCHYVNAPFWGAGYTQILFGFISMMYKLTGKTYYGSATNIAFKKSEWPGYDTDLSQGGDELDLLRKLKQRGHVVFMNSNTTFTSSRRLVRGAIYNFFVTLLFYYFLEYYLSRIFKRPVIGSAPKFRNNFTPRGVAIFRIGVVSSIVFLILAYRHHTGHHFDLDIPMPTRFLQ